ncbi:MAG: hypothetical protein ACFCU6_06870 [Balneolaceae bacterium]
MINYSKYDELIRKHHFDKLINEFEIQFNNGELDEEEKLYFGVILIHTGIYDFETAVKVFKSNKDNFESLIWAGFIYYFYHPDDSFFVEELLNKEKNEISNYILGLYYLRENQRDLACKYLKKAIEIKCFPKLLIAYSEDCFKHHYSKEKVKWFKKARQLILDNDAKYDDISTLNEYYKLRWDEDILGIRLPHEDFKTIYEN